MATTRMRTSTSTTVFHRVAAANDMATHDVGTSDAAVSGIGGTGEFQIDTDSDTTYIDTSKVADATSTGVAGGVANVRGGACLRANSNTAVAPAPKAITTRRLRANNSHIPRFYHLETILA